MTRPPEAATPAALSLPPDLHDFIARIALRLAPEWYPIAGWVLLGMDLGSRLR